MSLLVQNARWLISMQPYLQVLCPALVNHYYFATTPQQQAHINSFPQTYSGHVLPHGSAQAAATLHVPQQLHQHGFFEHAPQQQQHQELHAHQRQQAFRAHLQQLVDQHHQQEAATQQAETRWAAQTRSQQYPPAPPMAATAPVMTFQEGYMFVPVYEALPATIPPQQPSATSSGQDTPARRVSTIPTVSAAAGSIPRRNATLSHRESDGRRQRVRMGILTTLAERHDQIKNYVSRVMERRQEREASSAQDDGTAAPGDTNADVHREGVEGVAPVDVEMSRTPKRTDNEEAELSSFRVGDATSGGRTSRPGREDVVMTTTPHATKVSEDGAVVLQPSPPCGLLALKTVIERQNVGAAVLPHACRSLLSELANMHIERTVGNNGIPVEYDDALLRGRRLVETSAEFNRAVSTALDWLTRERLVRRGAGVASDMERQRGLAAALEGLNNAVTSALIVLRQRGEEAGQDAVQAQNGALDVDDEAPLPTSRIATRRVGGKEGARAKGVARQETGQSHNRGGNPLAVTGALAGALQLGDEGVTSVVQLHEALLASEEWLDPVSECRVEQTCREMGAERSVQSWRRGWSSGLQELLAFVYGSGENVGALRVRAGVDVIQKVFLERSLGDEVTDYQDPVLSFPNGGGFRSAGKWNFGQLRPSNRGHLRHGQYPLRLEVGPEFLTLPERYQRLSQRAHRELPWSTAWRRGTAQRRPIDFQLKIPVVQVMPPRGVTIRIRIRSDGASVAERHSSDQGNDDPESPQESRVRAWRNLLQRAADHQAEARANQNTQQPVGTTTSTTTRGGPSYEMEALMTVTWLPSTSGGATANVDFRTATRMRDTSFRNRAWRRTSDIYDRNRGNVRVQESVGFEFSDGFFRLLVDGRPLDLQGMLLEPRTGSERPGVSSHRRRTSGMWEDNETTAWAASEQGSAGTSNTQAGNGRRHFYDPYTGQRLANDDATRATETVRSVNQASRALSSAGGQGMGRPSTSSGSTQPEREMRAQETNGRAVFMAALRASSEASTATTSPSSNTYVNNSIDGGNPPPPGHERRAQEGNDEAGQTSLSGRSGLEQAPQTTTDDELERQDAAFSVTYENVIRTLLTPIPAESIVHLDVSDLSHLDFTPEFAGSFAMYGFNGSRGVPDWQLDHAIRRLY
ncbi:unnamed protein product [Amoebophrya sp. A25]|nr:unnamed protein product [Amoebophrya sp. A25]|eukprot:GSA25T00004280001.1